MDRVTKDAVLEIINFMVNHTPNCDINLKRFVELITDDRFEFSDRDYYRWLKYVTTLTIKYYKSLALDTVLAVTYRTIRETGCSLLPINELFTCDTGVHYESFEFDDYIYYRFPKMDIPIDKESSEFREDYIAALERYIESITTHEVILKEVLHESIRMPYLNKDNYRTFRRTLDVIDSGSLTTKTYSKRCLKDKKDFTLEDVEGLVTIAVLERKLGLLTFTTEYVAQLQYALDHVNSFKGLKYHGYTL